MHAGARCEGPDKRGGRTMEYGHVDFISVRETNAQRMKEHTTHKTLLFKE
jgi:hypothetical protein